MAATLALGSPTAWAGPAAPGASVPGIDEARALSDEGLAHFWRGEYGQAIAVFERSFAIHPASALLFDLGQAYRHTGECAKAADSFRRFLAMEPNSPQRASVEARITEMDRCSGVTAAAGPTSASESTPAPPAATIAPPSEAERAPLSTKAVPTSKTVEQPPTSAREPLLCVPAATPAADTTKIARATGLVMAGAGLLGLAAAIYASHQVVVERDSISRLFHDGGTWDPSWNAALARGQRDEKIAAVLYTGSGVALAAGLAVYYLLGHHNASPRKGVSVVLPRFDGIAWNRSF